MTAPRVAMALAAGRGSRMGEAGRITPKPLMTVGGKALIDHALDRALEAGVRMAVVNVHHLADQVEAHLAARVRPRIVISDERAALLETGGALRHARALLGEAPVFSLNTDAVFAGPPPLPPLVEAWAPQRMDALLLLVRRDQARAYTRPGDFYLGEDGVPVRRGARETAPYVYAGAQIVRPALFDDGPPGPFSANLVWDQAAARGRLFAVAHEGPWVDVGAPAGLVAADALLREGA
ncbi:MAG: nucleotidyltransferase family protein [Pseudomonadota bacterium]